ncbi:hypothetical protein RRG08_035195 [Elysia crispata]|uniref:Uncharacterized protein n=1 Tax=Elysia crispata TaxID=231223 RepID=A0AAE0XXP4_9GAST|nr:hypothetical protein RRG08_035195 [Elysia crispata]
MGTKDKTTDTSVVSRPHDSRYGFDYSDGELLDLESWERKIKPLTPVLYQDHTTRAMALITVTVSCWT